jgi:ATP-binding cassette subfamily B protein
MTIEPDLLKHLGQGSDLRRIWRLLRRNRSLALGQALMSLVGGLLEAAILTLFARIALSAVTNATGTVEILLIGQRPISTALVLLGFLIGSRLAVAALISFIVGHLQFRLVTSIRTEAVTSYSHASWLSQSDLDEGGLQQLVVVLPNKASSSISGLLKNFGELLIMISMFGYALISDPLLTFALVVAIIAASLAFLPLRRWIKAYSALVLRRQRSLSSLTTELSAIKFEAQAFGISEQVAQPVRELIVREGKFARRLSIVKSLVVPLYNTMTYSAVTVGLVFLQRSPAGNLDDIGPILLIVLRSLAYGQGIQQAAIAVASLMPILDFLQGQNDSLHSRGINWGSQNLTDIKEIELVDATFSYRSTDAEILRDVSFRIERGERVGIVGPSGGGKSTLMRLTLGLVEADSGRVLVNGCPLHGYDRNAWSRLIGVVPQSTELVRGTIADNIRLFRSGISEQDLWEALDIADLIRDVRAMPNALETEIGATARSLSGGQQQRLAIARAFATRPNLVLMDEPTSSIDAMSESAVSDAIKRLPSDVTVIIVSHRMGILRDCDRLIVMEGGVITASGTPEQVRGSSAYFFGSQEV